MFRILLFVIIAVTSANFATAQKKMLDHADFDIWKTIQREQISDDGRWVVYEVAPEDGDGMLHIYDGNNGTQRTYARGTRASTSADSRFVAFTIKPHQDSLDAMQRRKVKKDDMPKDSLAILDLNSGALIKIANVQSFKLPEKWSGWIAYHLEPAAANGDDENAQKQKKENKKNGSKLVIRNLASGEETTIGYATDYVHAEEGAKFMVVSTGDDADFQPGVYVFDGKLQPIFTHKGDYKNLTFDKKGTQVAFLADVDTTETRVDPYGLYHWREGQPMAELVANDDANFLPEDWRISENGNVRFSEDATKLYFGTAPQPILQDTSLLDDEIVNVEVWAYDQPELPTVQNYRLNQEKRRTYDAVWHTQQGAFAQIASEQLRDVRLGNEGNAAHALALDTEPYDMAATWEWWRKGDMYLIDTRTGEEKMIEAGVDAAYNSLSPGGKYAFWFNYPDSSWFAHHIETGTTRQLTDNQTVTFYNELDDHPDDPPPHGMAGWLKDDAAMLVYDRYDIWRVDPQGVQAPVRITNGRKDQQRIRYIRVDREERFIDPAKPMLVSVFNKRTKEDGYAWLNLADNKLTMIQSGKYSFSNRPLKAKKADKWVFTRENFQVFPDLLYSNDLKNFKQISNANPQQKDYRWGTAELYQWTSLDGEQLDGILIKPEGFDPGKKYPMMVYFYERSSDGLYRHRTPAAPRSSINFSHYASRGYLVFVPDIPYKIGYPGESCYNAVIPGVTSLIEKGFVDRERIGVQGHSWGGYQIAYLVTRSNIFKCAESGAPVVNMFSAYGGIRWGSGMSRSAQYERTQSRIGGSIWEYPLRYIENSPLFTADKIKTPLLILHNDADTAVPWYQGIEFFIALRRLGQPAWLLNYNGEPHGITKRQNRMDFNKRMQQFFDHYLLDAPKPMWMERGVPAIEKGIKQGYEPVSDKN